MQKNNKNVCMLVLNDFLHDARVTKEAETLIAAGYALTVIAVHHPEKTKKAETLANGISVKRVPQPSFLAQPRSLFLKLMRHAWLQVQFFRAAFQEKPDIYHSHDVNTLPATWLASVLRKKPFVYDAHEINSNREGYQAFQKPIRLIEKTLLKRASGMITTTDMRADFFEKHYGVRPIVLPNKPRYFKAIRSNKIREVLGLKDSRPIVLYQGSVHQGRGLENFVEAAAQIKEAVFVIIGSGKGEKAIKKLIEEKKLESRVFMIPAVPLEELKEYTCSADIGVQLLQNTCLNHYTTDSNKLFEYAMSGIPIVASDFPEIRKVVEKHQIGVLIDPSSLEDIVEKIESLVKDPGQLKRLKENTLRSAVGLGWEEEEQKLVELYGRIL
jgi:glycosyltransferase involved in cell wall biosynthesis